MALEMQSLYSMFKAQLLVHLMSFKCTLHINAIASRVMQGVSMMHPFLHSPDLDSKACKSRLAVRLIPLYVILACLCGAIIVGIILFKRIQDHKRALVDAYIDLN